MPDTLAEGAEVYSQDDHKLGTIKEIWGNWFKVDAKFQMDYWLSTDHVVSATADRVDVGFMKDVLADIKADYPEPAGASAGVVAGDAPVSTPIDPSAPADIALPAGIAEVRTGMDVYTHDGDHVGAVKAVRGNLFQVNAPRAIDFWLPLDLISLSDEIIGLTVDGAELGDYKVEVHPDDNTGEGFTAPTGAGITFHETAKSEKHMPN